MSVPEFLTLQNSPTTRIQVGGTGASAQDIGLTPFPFLTGLRQSAFEEVLIVETYKSNLALSEVQDAARRNRASPAAAFQAAWAIILATYTGTRDGIAFLTILPKKCNAGHSYSSLYTICKYNAQEQGQTAVGCVLTQFSESASHDIPEGDTVLSDSCSEHFHQGDGTLLDLEGLSGYSSGSNVEKDGCLNQPRRAPAIRIQVYQPTSGKLTFTASGMDPFITKDAAQLMLAQFDQILEASVSNPETPVDRIGTDFSSHLLSVSNVEPETVRCFSPLQSQFEDFAQSHPQCIALDFFISFQSKSPASTRKWTYEQLNNQAETFAAHLQSRFGSLINCIVPICMDRCAELYIAILGILKAGGAWCPIDPSFPPRRRHHLITRTGAQALITDAHSPRDGLPENVIPINITQIDWACTKTPRKPHIAADSIAYLIWTSGTTGAPKGVPIHHEAAVASMKALQASIPTDVTSGNIRCLQFSQYTFDVFVQDLFYTWGVGGTLISADRATMLGSFAELATKARATHAHLTPAFAASVPRKKCPTLEVVTMIGEKLTTNVADDWSQDCRLYNTYGPAETTVVSTLRLVPNGDTTQSANVGYPLHSVSAFVMQGDNRVMRHGLGELALGGAQLSKGYWRDSTKTQERFVWNERLQTTLYMTGDVVRQLYDGTFEFVGRTDDLVKIQGIRIELSEIAFALRACHANVEQVDVHFLDRPDRPSKVIVALLAAPGLGATHVDAIMNEPGVEVARSALVEAKTQLPDYMIPKVFIVVSTIPRTSSAKVDRAAIKRLYAEMDLATWERKLGSGGSEKETADELSPAEKAIIEVIARLTGTSKIAMSRESTLQSIGVDSITATRLATNLQAERFDASIADILLCVTVDDLLHRLFELHPAPSPRIFDVSSFHHETYDLLDPSLAQKVELVLPALPLQESLLSESLRNPISYWSQCFFALESGVDLDLLEKSWRTVALCTDALRIGFLPVAELSKRCKTNATFLQLIHTEAQCTYTILHSTASDLRAQAKYQAQQTAERMQRNHFTEPPWAVTVFVQDSRSVMMLSIHHSIRDEPSLNIIMENLQQAYSSNASDEPLQRRHQLREATSLLYAGSKQSENDENFWAETLSAFRDGEDSKSWPKLKLTDQNNGEGTITYISREEKSHKELQARATRIGAASVASLLRVVWGCVLLEYLETDKIVLGETRSARSEAATLADVVGPLISVVPVPFQIQGTMREVLQGQASFQKQSKAHCGIHPRIIRRVLGRPKHEALYPAIFNFIPDYDEQSNSDSSNLWRKMDDIVGLSVEHVIALNVLLKRDDTLKIEITANRHYMDHAHLDILARQIYGLLDLVLDNPDQGLNQLTNRMDRNLLSVTPTNDGISANVAWTQGPTEWVDRNAFTHPDWLAAEVISSFDNDHMHTGTWSYGQLRKAYQNVAAMINNAGCAKRSIAVCLERSLDIYPVILAIMSTGNIYLPIAEDLPRDRKRLLLRDSDAAILFTTVSLAADFSHISQSCRTLFVEDIDYSTAVEARTNTSPEPTDNAYLLYTSGSTGTPKGVLVSRGNLMSFIEAISHFISSHVGMPELGGRGKWLGMASYAFDVHLLEIFFAWRHGMATVTAPRAMLLDNLELALQKLKVTHASFVPSLVDNTGLDPANLPDLRYMSLGGEKITRKAIDTWSRSHVCLANAYGPTEVTIGCSFQTVKPDTNVRNIGFPLSYTVAHVLRFETEEYALRGTSGELCLTGDLVANGYHKRPDAKGFVEDFHGQRMYRTGDRVRLMADGSIEFLGRNDDQTKIRGQRIELGEVSEAVRAAAGQVMGVDIVGAAAIVVQHPLLARPQLVAFVAAQDNGRRINGESLEIISFPNTGTADQIRVHCSNALPSFMVPDHIIRLTTLPLVTISRKVDNKHLRTLFAEISLADLTSEEKAKSWVNRAMSEAEEAVSSVAADVLAVDKNEINRETNLFRLGLDSLNIISLTIKLQKIGFESTVSNTLKSATVEQIALLPRNRKVNGGPTPASNSSQDLEKRFRASGANGLDYSNIAAIRTCLPLQESLVASSLDHEGEGFYVNHVTLEMSPDVDLDELIQAWTTTAEEHDILRTCFRGFENHFVQVVLKESPLSCDRITTSDADSRLSYLRHRAPEIASDIIENIASKPPIRLTLAASHTDQQGSMILISIHHSLYDSESFAMILDEVYARYERTPTNKARTPLTALTDHIESQSQRENKAFWTSYLAGYRSTLMAVPSVDHGSTSITRQMSAPLANVESLAASLNSTAASIIQGLFGVVLIETLGTNDIVFGTVLSGRTVPVENADTILAPCIATIPQRVQLKTDSSLLDIVSTARKGFVDSIEHQHTALRCIHRWVQAEKPLFDTIFSYARKTRPPQWSHLWWEAESSMPSEFPLAVEIVADYAVDRLCARCDFTSAFGTIEEGNSFLDRLEQLIQSLLQGENLPLKKSTHNANGVLKKPLDRNWSKTEALMRDIVAEIVGLGPGNITKGASFFALGVDSIIAIQFAKRLRHHDIHCSSSDVMRYSSISGLAQHIELQGKLSAITDKASTGLSSSDTSNQAQDENSRLATYPCTPLQSSMLTQTLGTDGSLYVHHHAIRVSAEVEASKMKKAWADLVETAEILQTSFRYCHQSYSWYGVVKRPSYIALNEHDPSLSLEHVMPRIKESLVFRKVEDFARSPWAINIIGKVYVFSLHHSLYDGESLRRLFADLSSLLKGAQIPARPSFSGAARAIYERTAEAEEYWVSSLDGFAGSSATSSTGEFHEMRVALTLDQAAILESCRSLGVTLQSVALLAYGKTLAWLSRRQDVVFGHIVRGRTLMLEADDVVGPLFNTVPVRVNLEGISVSNGDAARSLQHMTGDSQAYQHASLSRIQQTWRENIKNPDAELLDALFVFQKRAGGHEDRLWTSIDIVENAAPTEYSTNLEFEQGEDGIAVCVNSRCIEDLDGFVQTFELILRDILDHPEDIATALLDRLPILEGKPSKSADVSNPADRSNVDSTNDKLDVVRELLARISGIPKTNIPNEASIFSLGLDSISAIQIAQVGRKEGLKISVADVLQGRTVIGISQRLQQKMVADDRTIASQPERIPSQRSHTSTIQDRPRLEALTLTGLREDDVENFLPCLPGQVYHLATWLESGRTLGEATFTYTCKEALDVGRLLGAWRSLRERHAILRTLFVATTGTEAIQIVLKPAAIRSDAFQYIDLPAVDRDGIAQVVKQEACRRFDLFSSPVGLVLLRGGDGDYMILRLHHALYDAWTIPIVLDDLTMLYHGKIPPTATASSHASSLLEDILQLSSATSAQDYWRKSLHNCQPTILRSTHPHPQIAPTPSFHCHKTSIPNLQDLETRCQDNSISLPTLILLAIARVLAQHTSVPSPVFGLFQTGRSSASSGISTSSMPCLNVTPLMARAITSPSPSSKAQIEALQADLAARIPHEQSYLRDILSFVGAEAGTPLFNTFVNILWAKEGGQLQPESRDEGSLSLWKGADGDAIAPRYGVEGRTAVDGLETGMLGGGKLFLDVQRDGEGDCVRLFGRCDGGVLGEEEAGEFLDKVGVEVGRVLGGCVG